MRYLALTIICLSLVSPQMALAQSTADFSIHLDASAPDVTPPTTPTLLSVDPIAPTQIDLGWSAATDDYAVTGYVVSRGGVPIATTTLLSYSDTGLAASTTYTYVVQAFDSALNYSSTSNSISTTTPQLPPPTPSEDDAGNQSGTVARTVLEELVITTGVSTATLQLVTARPARIEVRWGKTASYELGYVMSDVYTTKHSTQITDLEPGTKYEYEVIGYTPYGVQSIIKSGTFTTESNNPATSPANVNYFQAIQVGSDVDISWQMPTNETISHVRIVRSHLGFPEYPQNGAIVYQGKGESVRDVGILNIYSPVYYTAFVYDVFGNVSSGAIALVYLDDDDFGDGILTGVPSGVTTPGDLEVVATTPTSSFKTERITPTMKMPDLSEVLIIQQNNPFKFSDKNVLLNSSEEFHIVVPKRYITGNIKSIIAAVIDPIDATKIHSFLLRINKDQTAYEATVASLGSEGRSKIIVSVYDYEVFAVATYQTPVMFQATQVAGVGEVVFPDIFYQYIPIVFPVIVGTLILIIIGIILYRLWRPEDKG